MIVLWVLTATYVFFILFLRFGMSKLERWETEHFTANTRFSIIIPFRNEEHNLPTLLKSIAALDYPKDRYELILVDDDSQDESAVVCREFLKVHPDIQAQLLTGASRASSIMTAIESGIQAANYEYILRIDAHYILPEGHLSAFNAQLLHDKVDMMIGPLAYPILEMREKRGFLSDFQSLDLLSLQAATQGSFGVGKPFLCSDVSLCYSKIGYETVKGFSENHKGVGEDNNYLLEKFLKADLRLAYVKNPAAVVRSPRQDNWKEVLSQRADWVTKTTANKNALGKWIGLLVFLTNIVLVLGIPAMLFNLLEPQYYAIAFVFKFNADFLLLYPMASFLDMESPMRRYLWCSVFYPFFSSWVGLKSLFLRLTLQRVR